MRKYDSYTGVTVIRHGTFEDKLREQSYGVRLFADGYAALHVDSKSGILGTTYIPDQVWPSMIAWGDWVRAQSEPDEEDA